MFQKIGKIFVKRSPDWLFALVWMFLWGINFNRKSILLLPYKHLWLAITKEGKFFLHSPKDILATLREIHSSKHGYFRYFGIEEGEVVVDVGANIGQITLPMAQRTGKEGKVIAIEPDPENLFLLKLNLSGFDNVRIVENCVWNCKERLKLYRHYISVAHSVIYRSDEYIEVEADTLDNIVSSLGIEKIDFLKIDAEGAGIEILQGAENVLKTTKKVVVSAYHLRQDKPTLTRVRHLLKRYKLKIRVTSDGIVYARK